MSNIREVMLERRLQEKEDKHNVGCLALFVVIWLLWLTMQVLLLAEHVGFKPELWPN